MMQITEGKKTPLFRTKRRYIFKTAFCLAAAFCLTAAMASCRPASQKSERSFFAMDTLMDLTAYGDTAKAALEECEQKITEIESRLSAELSQSEIYKLNASGGEPSRVGRDTLSLIETAALVSERSGGAFDITVRPFVKAWGFTGGDYRVPPERELTELLESVGYANIKIDGDTVTLENGAQLDLGAIAKGYASDEMKKILTDNGVLSAVISLGGNVLAHGSRPDGSAWRIGISKPDGSADIAAVLRVSDTCVVTSGGYQRFFEQNGVVYSHILDPKTGRPAETDLLSVTVICENGALADALSTALFVLGEDGAIEYYNTYGGFEAVLITRNNKMICTAGLGDGLTEPGGEYTVEYR